MPDSDPQPELLLVPVSGSPTPSSRCRMLIVSQKCGLARLQRFAICSHISPELAHQCSHGGCNLDSECRHCTIPYLSAVASSLCHHHSGFMSDISLADMRTLATSVQPLLLAPYQPIHGLWSLLTSILPQFSTHSLLKYRMTATSHQLATPACSRTATNLSSSPCSLEVWLQSSRMLA